MGNATDNFDKNVALHKKREEALVKVCKKETEVEHLQRRLDAIRDFFDFDNEELSKVKGLNVFSLGDYTERMVLDDLIFGLTQRLEDATGELEVLKEEFNKL